MKKLIELDPCIAKARPDEPGFIILGRDPVLVPVMEQWCVEREKMITNGTLDDTPQERGHIDKVRNELLPAMRDYRPKSFGRGEASIDFDKISSNVASTPLNEQENRLMREILSEIPLDVIAKNIYDQRMRSMFPGFDLSVPIHPREGLGPVLKYEELPYGSKLQELSTAEVVVNAIVTALTKKYTR